MQKTFLNNALISSADEAALLEAALLQVLAAGAEQGGPGEDRWRQHGLLLSAGLQRQAQQVGGLAARQDLPRALGLEGRGATQKICTRFRPGWETRKWSCDGDLEGSK